ncbi:HD domain-containing protein [Chloroflexota bacterium]
MKANEQIRLGVIKSLPEAKEIRDQKLRERVYDAWAMSLAESGYQRIEDMPCKGVWDVPPLKSGTQADHLRGVARLSIAIAKELKDTFDEFDVDMDEVIAGGLCHDLGKPFEFNPDNLARWKTDPRKTGLPATRHSVYGMHIALSAGLPESIAHIVINHSKEGEFVRRSLACEIVRYADHTWWWVLRSAGLQKEQE